MMSDVDTVEGRTLSATGPIRRVPSAADTTRLNSFPGSHQGVSAHYTPYGTVFAAATQQAAAAAAAAANASGSPPSGHLQPALPEEQQQLASRRLPQRQHSFDHRMLSQRPALRAHVGQYGYAHHQQQHRHHLLLQGYAFPAGADVSACLQGPVSHTVACRCDSCQATHQRAETYQQLHTHQYLQQQQQQQQLLPGTATTACTCASCMMRPTQQELECQYQQHQQQQDVLRLGAMLSGPPSLGSRMAATEALVQPHTAAGAVEAQAASADGAGGPAAGSSAHWGFLRADAQVAAYAGATTHQGTVQHDARQYGGHDQQHTAPQQHHHQQYAAAAAWDSSMVATHSTAAPGYTVDQQWMHRLCPYHLQQYQQHQHQQVPLHAHSTHNHTHGLLPMMSAPPHALVPSAAAPAAAAAATARMHHIPAGLSAVRVRPQAGSTAMPPREQPCWTTTGAAGGTTDAAAAAAAQAAAAGRDMVIHPQQQQDTGRWLPAPAHAERPYKQPQLRQQELQQLLQHQLRQLVPAQGAAAAAAAAAAAPGQANCATAVEVDLKDPAVLLELLRHSGMCKVSEEACALGWRCTWVKRLWIHMHTCRSDSCASEHCRLGKRVLPHYKQCSDAACTMCRRVRSYDKALAELQALTGRVSSAEGESVDSQGTSEDTPSTVMIAGDDDPAAAAAAGCAAAAMSPALSVTSKPSRGRLSHLADEQQLEQAGQGALEPGVEEVVGVRPKQREQPFQEAW